jgi:hypothetical protein
MTATAISTITVKTDGLPRAKLRIATLKRMTKTRLAQPSLPLDPASSARRGHQDRSGQAEWQDTCVLQIGIKTRSSGPQAVTSVNEPPLHEHVHTSFLHFHPLKLPQTRLNEFNPHPEDLIPLRPTFILSSRLRLGLPSHLFPSDFPTKILHAFLTPPPHARHTPFPPPLIWLNDTWWRVNIPDLPIMQIYSASRQFIPRTSKYSPLCPVLKQSQSVVFF